MMMSLNFPLSLKNLAVMEPVLQQLQQTTPDTSNYMIGGFAVIFGAMLIYLISLIIRGRNLRQDFEILQELENRSNSPLNSASQPEKPPSS
ncbi:MAG: hypothetical protein R6V73_14815 [Anaerolineales bacterium]|jgi:hypothetical protein